MNKKKKCIGCGEHKKNGEFYKSKTRCKICDSEKYKIWYELNENSRRYKKIRYYELLLNSECIDCRENDPACLEFDHVRGRKVASVSNMIFKNYTWKTIQKEIKKCEIRCSNCHKKKTAKEQGWYQKVKKYLNGN